MKFQPIALTLAALLFAGTAVAQKSVPKSPFGPTTTVPNVVSTAEVDKPFQGTIYYRAAKPTESREKGVASSHASVDEPKSYVAFVKESAYSDIMGMFSCVDMKKGIVTVAARHTEGEPLRGSFFKLGEFPGVDIETFDKIARLQEKGSYKEAEAMLDKYYTRTKDTKKIAGQLATRYTCAFLGGDIWVAEEINLNAWCAPFWGLLHPVLEFNFTYMFDDVKAKPVRMTAFEVEKDEVRDHLVKEADNFDRVSPDETKDMLRKVSEHYSK